MLYVCFFFFFFFFKQKTAYEIYQCDWSSDVCSSDLCFRVLDKSKVFIFKFFYIFFYLFLCPLYNFISHPFSSTTNRVRGGIGSGLNDIPIVLKKRSNTKRIIIKNDCTTWEDKHIINPYRVFCVCI